MFPMLVQTIEVVESTPEVRMLKSTFDFGILELIHISARLIDAADIHADQDLLELATQLAEVIDIYKPGYLAGFLESE